MKALELKNIKKSFGKNNIIKDISLSIQEGEFLILVGPSGCGKSTLLNCIAGLDQMDDGDIFIHEKNVSEDLPKDRDIAMVFQSYALYPSMTVRENIAFGLRMRKRSKEYIEQKINEVSKTLQIEHLLDRKPAKLSGGQRQRVAMGRAMARKPSLFLFDEPLSNLDAKLRVTMRKEIKQLHEDLGCATVYVTHDQVEAMTLGDRIAIMKEGVVVQLGTPEEVYRQPKNIYVAQFMGSPSMNIIPTSIVEHEGHKKLKLMCSDEAYYLKAPEHVQHKQEVMLGIRPEHVTSKPSRSLEPFEVQSTIQFKEPTGADTLVFTQINNTEVVARCRPKHVGAKNSNMPLYLNQQRLHFFDADTGDSLGGFAN